MLSFKQFTRSKSDISDGSKIKNVYNFSLLYAYKILNFIGAFAKCSHSELLPDEPKRTTERWKHECPESSARWPGNLPVLVRMCATRRRSRTHTYMSRKQHNRRLLEWTDRIVFQYVTLFQSPQAQSIYYMLRSNKCWKSDASDE